MKKICYVFMYFSILFVLSCSKDKEERTEVEEMPSAIFVDVSQDTYWDYWVAAKDGSNMFIKAENNLPSEVFIQASTEYEGYPIFFDDLGYPEKAVINQHIFLFSNFYGSKVDVSIITPEGEVYTQREIESDINWDELSLKNTNVEASDVIRWAGHAASATACIVGLAGSPVGIGIPMAYIGCGAAVVGIAAEFLPDDYEILGISATAVGTFATVVGCIESAGASCTLGLAASALSYTAEAVEDIENNERIVNGVPIRISSFLSNDDIAILEDMGMVFNRGYAPPSIVGYYYADSWQNQATGSNYIEYTYNFFNQHINNNIDMQVASSSTSATGTNGYISGNDSEFTVYLEEFSVAIDNTDDHEVNIRLASVYSGIISDEGIVNFQHGFIILDKEDDYNGLYMNVGDARVVYESDYLADVVYEFPFAASNSHSVKAGKEKAIIELFLAE